MTEMPVGRLAGGFTRQARPPIAIGHLALLLL
jgi:hypothetical protein